MNSHLSSAQLDGVLSGEGSQTAALHLNSCAECAKELATLREVFGDLREATAAAAEHHRHFAPATPRRGRPGMAWGLAAAALFVSITTPLALHLRNTATGLEGASSAAATTVSDEALLDSVQDDLSSSVPRSLLPLAATSTGTTNSTTEQRKN